MYDAIPMLFAKIAPRFPDRPLQVAMLLTTAALIAALPAICFLTRQRHLLTRPTLRGLLLGMCLLAVLFAIARWTSAERSRQSLLIPVADFALCAAPVVMIVLTFTRSSESARRVGLAMLMTGLVCYEVAMLADLRLHYAGRWTSFNHLEDRASEFGLCLLSCLLFFIPFERLWLQFEPGSSLDRCISGEQPPRDLPQRLGIEEGQAGGPDGQHEDEHPG